MIIVHPIRQDTEELYITQSILSPRQTDTAVEYRGIRVVPQEKRTNGVSVTFFALLKDYFYRELLSRMV